MFKIHATERVAFAEKAAVALSGGGGGTSGEYTPEIVIWDNGSVFIDAVDVDVNTTTYTKNGDYVTLKGNFVATLTGFLSIRDYTIFVVTPPEFPPLDAPAPFGGSAIITGATLNGPTVNGGFFVNINPPAPPVPGNNIQVAMTSSINVDNTSSSSYSFSITYRTE